MVHCKPAGYGNHALKYQAPYGYRVGINNNRIEKIENDRVTFRYKNSDTHQWQTATLPALEFIHRFLQHVLPKNFVKIHYYGFMAPKKRNLLAVAKYLMSATSVLAEVTSTVDRIYICPHCGAKLLWAKPLSKSPRAPP